MCRARSFIQKHAIKLFKASAARTLLTIPLMNVIIDEDVDEH